MEIAAQRQSITQRPLGFILVVLFGVVLWTLFSSNSTGLVLAVIFIMFIYGIVRPVWAMGAFLISQMSIPSYMIGTISLRLLLLILMGFIVWRIHVQEGIQLGKKAKRVIIPVAILVVISIVANLLNSSFDFVFKDFRNMATGLLIVIFLPVVIRNIKDLKLLSGIALIGMTISTIIALMQHYNILGAAQYLLIAYRAQGISGNELELAYLLGVAMMAVIGVLISEGIKKGNHRLLIIAIVMLPTLYFTYTRSALIAFIFGLIALFLFFKTRIRAEIILLAIIALTLFFSISGVTDNFSFSGRSDIGQEASAISRKILWQAGIAIAKDNMVIGIGGDRYLTLAPQYEEAVDPSLIQWEEDRYYSYRTLGNEPIHNDFLNMWVSYGIFALIAFLWIILVVLRNCIDSFRLSKHRFIKGLSIGLAAGLITYAVNAFYHNLLAEFSLLWVVAGFSVAVAKLSMIGNEARR
jgi:O-antigen ligase